jgi:hypothetical protein
MTDDTRRQPLTLARLWMRENIIVTVLSIFILLSLLLHALTLGALFRVRSIVQRQLEVSAEQMAAVREQKVRYNFPVDQTFTIDTTVALSETLTVPLSIEVPIKQSITLPIDTPLGQVPITVPLDLTVPVSDTVQVPINKQIPFKVDIPIKTEIPIDISLSEPPLGDILRQFEEALKDLRDRL